MTAPRASAPPGPAERRVAHHRDLIAHRATEREEQAARRRIVAEIAARDAHPDHAIGDNAAAARAALVERLAAARLAVGRQAAEGGRRTRKHKRHSRKTRRGHKRRNRKSRRRV
jgi:hypothetical protein